MDQEKHPMTTPRIPAADVLAEEALVLKMRQDSHSVVDTAAACGYASLGSSPSLRPALPPGTEKVRLYHFPSGDFRKRATAGLARHRIPDAMRG